VLTAELEVPVDDGFDLALALAHTLALFARFVRKLPLEQKHQPEVTEQLFGDVGFAGQRLETVGSGMTPACHLGLAALPVQVVVQGVGVSDQEALVAAQELVDGSRVVTVAEGEDDMAPRHDEHPEVPALALLGRLHQHTRRIRAQVRRSACVAQHGFDQRSKQLAQARRASRTKSSVLAA
jgi:hypothetical protein